LPTRALARKPYRRSSIDSSHEYIVAPAINELTKKHAPVMIPLAQNPPTKSKIYFLKSKLHDTTSHYRV